MIALFVTTVAMAQLHLVPTRGPADNIAGNARSSFPVLSADGRTLVFLSQASDLTTNLPNGDIVDVFARNLITKKTALVSVATDGIHSGNNTSGEPRISADGRYVVFESLATNLVTSADTNNESDVFLRDLVDRTTILVSAAAMGNSTGDGSSRNARFSADGRYVLYESLARNLVVDDGLAQSTNLFVYDRVENTNRLIKGIEFPVNPINLTADWLHSLAFSPDGRYSVCVEHVVATSYIADDFYVFLTDWANHSNQFVFAIATNTFGTNINQLFFDNFAFSANGRYLTYKASSGTNKAGIFWRDLEAEVDKVVTTNLAANAVRFSDSSGPVMTSDGRNVIFATQGSIYRWDSATEALNMVAAGVAPQISADGAWLSFLIKGEVVRTNLQTGAWSMISSNTLTGAVSGGDIPNFTSASAGQVFAFEAYDNNLVPGDRNKAFDVFVVDAVTSSIELASARDSSRSPGGRALPSQALSGGTSSDGRYVVFSSIDDWIMPEDTNGWSDIFVHDLYAGTHRLASVGLDGASANGPSFSPSISADGNRVVFVSAATNLVAGDTNNVADVFWRDLRTGTTIMVSTNLPNVATVGSSPSMSLDGNSVTYERAQKVYLWRASSGATLTAPTNTGVAPIISPDGRWVAFFKTSSQNLTLWDSDSNIVYPIQAGSVLTSGFSADGRYLLVNSTSGSPPVYLYDLLLNTNSEGVSPATSSYLSVNGDGRYVVFTSSQKLDGRDTNNLQDVYLRDRLLQTNILVSLNTNEASAGNDRSLQGTPSLDGRFVLFKSMATDLAPGVTNRIWNIYLRDLLTRTTTLVTPGNPLVFPQNRPAVRPQFSRNGQDILFNSRFADASETTVDGVLGLFLYRTSMRAVSDSDGDGMDDAWELANFGGLGHNGLFDSDGDGMTDHEEFLAGTSPLDPTSFFSGTILRASNGTVRVIWNSIPGRKYKVQFKNLLSDTDWTDLEIEKTANALQSEIVDSVTNVSNRFYRVLLVP